MSPRVNVLIGSGGRRNYLVNWFREAIKDLGIQGSVCVLDAARSAPALADADLAATVPPFSSDEYFPAVAELCREWDVDLALSLNDYEATQWSTSANAPFENMGINLIAPSGMCQALVEDKAAYRRAFESALVSTPETLTGAEALALTELPWQGEVIVKHRYGSGSVGLARVAQGSWRSEVLRVAETARDRFGEHVVNRDSGLVNVVVQQAIDGAEYGVDVVHDFEGQFVSTLVRRKLRMRSGETDQAVTVAPDDFVGVARAIGEVTAHRGLIDTDVLVDDAGQMFVIDVNPRFGGGYPFSHVAGARIPHAYLAWHLGRPVEIDWCSYSADVTSAKTEDIRIAASPTSFPRTQR